MKRDRKLAVSLLFLACVAHASAQDAQLAQMQRLNAEVLSSRSATLSLEKWCGDHRLADTPRITARPINDAGRAPSTAQRQRLQVGDGDEVKYRRVQLRCGNQVLSEAENWYVPGRLTAGMNRLLETTDTPFGTAVRSLDPSRETFDVTMLWSGAPPIPDALFEHRAVLYTRDHQPFSEVHEVYQRQILASPPPATPQPEIATMVAFTEGPAADRDGNVYFTDIINERIMKLGRDGVLSIYREHSNVANGLLIDPQGRLIACEGAEFERPGIKLKGKPRVTRTDLKTGAIEILAETYEGQPLQGPNDVTIDGKGRLYFTDLPGAAVYRIDAPGKLARILAAPEIQRPNGIQVSPDDRKLYLVEANPAQGGARMIRSFITNNAFGGPDMKTLYVTAGKTLYTVRTEIAGLPR